MSQQENPPADFTLERIRKVEMSVDSIATRVQKIELVSAVAHEESDNTKRYFDMKFTALEKQLKTICESNVKAREASKADYKKLMWIVVTILVTGVAQWVLAGGLTTLALTN
jgi:uncharacterized protein YgbK (DUF1537 family)